VNYHCQLEDHPVGDVEPVKFFVQYLTQATIKLPSAGDDARSSVQHTLLQLICTLTSIYLWKPMLVTVPRHVSSTCGRFVSSAVKLTIRTVYADTCTDTVTLGLL